MSKPQPKKRGAPKKLNKLDVQKHVFMDQPTADKLAEIARDEQASESAVIRTLIVKHYEGTL